MKKIFVMMVAFLSFGFSLCAYSEEKITAPFGLTWGASQADMSDLNLECQDSNGFVVCSSANVPKKVSFGESYQFVFDTQLGLQRSVMIGKTLTSDIYGTEGKKTYNAIKRSLQKKYGDAETSVERIALKLYKESDEFYQCLSYDGCGYYLSYWEGSFGGVELSINGLRRGEGWMKLMYDGPSWGMALERQKNQTSAADEGAF